MTGTDMTLIELLQQHDEGNFLRAATEALLRTPMQHDVEGVIGAGRQSVATVGRPAGSAVSVRPDRSTPPFSTVGSHRRG